MSWSSRLFLLSADDELHRLAGTAFSRMLRPGNGCRLPQFTGQRVRLASVTVELVDGIPLGVAMLDFDAHGVLDVQRLNDQQVARVDTLLAGVLGSASQDAQIVEAASRFVARGGEWNADPALRRRVEAAGHRSSLQREEPVDADRRTHGIRHQADARFGHQRWPDRQLYEVQPTSGCGWAISLLRRLLPCRANWWYRP